MVGRCTGTALATVRRIRANLASLTCWVQAAAVEASGLLGKAASAKHVHRETATLPPDLEALERELQDLAANERRLAEQTAALSRARERKEKLFAGKKLKHDREEHLNTRKAYARTVRDNRQSGGRVDPVTLHPTESVGDATEERQQAVAMPPLENVPARRPPQPPSNQRRIEGGSRAVSPRREASSLGIRVRFHMIRNARIENVGHSQSCMVSK